MAFQLEGSYVENGNGGVIGPCPWSSLSRAATNDRGNVLVAGITARRAGAVAA